MDREDMKQAQLRQSKLQKWARDINNIDDSISSSNGALEVTQSNPTVNLSEMPYYDDTNIGKMQQFMESLPWYDLPLADSIAFNPRDKWKQCNDIYHKFIGDDAFCSINVGYMSAGKIHYNFDRLAKFVMESKTKVGLTSVGSQSNVTPDPGNITITITPSTKSKDLENDDHAGHAELTLDYQTPVAVGGNDGDKILNEEQFEKELLDVFDVAIKDVIHNLNDSLRRFINTDYFKLIHNN